MPMVKDPDGRAGWKNPKPVKEEPKEMPKLAKKEPEPVEEKPKKRSWRNRGSD